MAEASGWGVLPLSVSFSGIYKDLQKQLVEPATKAGKTAGQAVASEMKSGAEAAAKAVESAQYRQKKSSEELRAAESKLTEQKLKSEAANQAVEAAARKRADAESKGIDAIERAEQDLLKKRANAEKAARDLAGAEQKVEDALGKSARATENLEQKQKALDAAQDDTEQSAGKLSGRLKEMGDEADSAGGMFDGLTGKVGGFVGAFAGIAGVGALIAEGMDVSGQVDKMNRQLGLTGEAAEQMGADVTAVMKSGWGAEEAVSAIGSLTSQFSYLGFEGEQTAQELSDNFLAFTDTFEMDMAEATQMAGQLIENGLAKDVEHATDLMTAAMQRVPAAMRDELPEIMNEYGTNFKNLGLSGEEAFELLVRQAGNGAIALDKTGDALKEFTIRGSDMSEASSGAFEAIGLNAEEMARKIASGGEGAQEALMKTAGGLQDIEDPAERANTAIALFGAPLEDLGVDQIPAFLDGLTGMGDGMLGAEGASQALADEIGNSLEGRMATLKGTVSALATEGFMWLWDVAENKVIPALKNVGTWIQDNEKWIAPLAATIGGAAAAWGLWTAAVKGWEFATKVATGVQMAFNLVMNANPIMLVVTALAAVAAGLVYFFTQTETGREMWSKFTTALADGWNWATEKVGGGIDWLQEKFDKFTGWISDAWNGITSLFGKGDYTGEMASAFGIEEDSPIISFFFTVRDLITDIKGYITGVWDILFKGDYTGLPFGLEEDSGLVNFFFTIRETAIKTGEIITAVWDGIVTAGKVAFAILGTVVLTPLMLAWNALSWGIREGYENIIKPTWDLMASAAMWLWENGIKPALEAISEKWDLLQLLIGKAIFEIRLKIYEFQTAITALWLEYVQPVLDAIRSKWDQLSAAMTAAWNVIKTAVFDAWNAYVNQVKANWDLVTTAINNAWTALKDHFTSIWNTIKTSVLDAWNTAVTFLRDTFNTITENISSKWSWLKDQLSSVWAWVKDNVFGAFHTALDRIKSGFETTVDAIGTAWGWLKRKTAEPINFVIETVYNEGIKKAWDAVAGLVGLDDLPRMDKIGGYAEGTSRIPGARTRHDNMHMMTPDGRFGISLRGGEGVLVPEAVDALGESTIDRWNSIALREGASGVARSMEHMGGFANGGRIRRQTPFFGGAVSAVQRSQEEFVERFFPNIFTLTSATRYSDNGLHSTGQATDWQDNGAQRPTPRSKALARAIATNFPNTAELIHWPNDGWSNISNGSPHDFGPGTNADHQNHVHWGTRGMVKFDGDNIVLDDAPGGGFFESIASMAKRLWDGVIDKIPGYSGDTGGQFAKLPGAFLKKTAGAAWDHIKGLADKMLSFGGGSGGGAEQWRDLSRTALRRFGYSDDTYLDAMVRQIEIESGGDPNIVNNWDSNAAKGIPSAGLLQVIDPTYRDVRNRYPDAFEGLPDDRMHPLTNLVAGIGALKRDWGGPEGGRWPTTGGYHDGGLMGAGEGWIHKTATEPEMVLSPKMTKAFIDWMKVPDGESVRVISRELADAFNGGDWGMGELASYIGIELAESIINGAAALGEISRTIGEQAQKSGTDYATTQATGALDVMGLGGLVPLGMNVGQRVADLAALSPVQAHITPNGVVVEIDAEGGDFVHVDQVQQLADRVQGLEVKVTEKKKPLAAAVTRGGVM